MRRARSYLYVPGHRERMLAGAFGRGADIVVLDLEDAVPPTEKERARSLVAETIADHEAVVRVNRPGTDLCGADLAAVVGRATALRLPKVESAEEVGWVRERAPGIPLDCSIESALGVLRAFEIASAPGVTHLSFGNADLAADLGVENVPLPLFHARCQVVLASRAAGIGGPGDGVYVHLSDLDGLRRSALLGRRLGFESKSALHPDQISVINDVFAPSEVELGWAQRVVDAFTASGGSPIRLDDGEFVDVPVAERARRILEQA